VRVEASRIQAHVKEILCTFWFIMESGAGMHHSSSPSSISRWLACPRVAKAQVLKSEHGVAGLESAHED
jgi:hypothetical protein